MTLNVTSPVSPVVTPASPAQASSGNGSGGSSSTKAVAQTPSDKPAGTNAGAATKSASSSADAAANAASDADLFARLLGAQMDTLGAAAAPLVATDVASTADKPAKSASPLANAADPSLLLNPALAALQQQLAPPPVAKTEVAVQSPVVPGADAAKAAADAASLPAAGAVVSAAVTAPATPSARPDAKLAQEADKTSFDDLSRAAIARQAASPLQNLPQDGAGQSTILPQNTQPAATAAVEKPVLTPQSYNVDQHVGTPAWGKAIGEHVMTMVNMKAESAHIQVSPPQLGPIEVSLKMDAHNNAQITFTADSPATRAALENSLPKLHTMMAASGIQLGDAQVSSGQSQRQQQQAGQQNRFNGRAAEVVEGEEADTLASIKAARGVLSIFA